MLELTRCLQPNRGTVAEVTARLVLEGTDGPVEHVRTRCMGARGEAGEPRHFLTFDVAGLVMYVTASGGFEQTARQGHIED
jgi:hypothetical protein